MIKSLSQNKNYTASLQCYIWNNLNGSFWENILWWFQKWISASYLDAYWSLSRWFCERLNIQWYDLKKGEEGIFVLGLTLSWKLCMFKSSSFPSYSWSQNWPLSCVGIFASTAVSQFADGRFCGLPLWLCCRYRVCAVSCSSQTVNFCFRFCLFIIKEKFFSGQQTTLWITDRGFFYSFLNHGLFVRLLARVFSGCSVSIFAY